MVMKFIKLPFKLLALPIILILMAAALLIKLVTNLSAYVMGPLMLFILGCGIYSAVQQMWTSVAILVVLEILCVAAMFFAVVIETALNGMRILWWALYIHKIKCFGQAAPQEMSGTVCLLFSYGEDGELWRQQD